jgi:hypothetical protein
MAPMPQPEGTPLLLHVGLPKTATTFLQRTIFEHTPDLIYVHRQGPDEKHLGRCLWCCQRVGEEKLAATLTETNASIGRIHQKRQTKARTMLISEESISMGRMEIWDGSGPTPGRVAARTAAFARSGDLPHRSVKVILGVRRQDQWLASRYAQSASEFDQPGEGDFEKRAREICAGGLDASLQWLDYAEARRQLLGALGEESVFIVPMELLGAAPRRLMERMGHFLGGVPLADVYSRAEQNPRMPMRRNAKSTGPNSWKLRRTETSITLSKSTTDVIRERFKDSNEELSEAIGVDLQSLGYW